MHEMTKAMMDEHGVKDFSCTCCERKLNPETATWLELNKKTNRYAKPGTVAEEESQGCFIFGQACAKRALKQ